MSSIKNIQSEVKKLPKRELRRFRDWFDEYDANLWDQQIENDIKKDKFNKLAEEAKRDFKKGRCTQF
jgi:mRNA-degrading endonuclease RelE of RelBE toxin-antitoxin system